MEWWQRLNLRDNPFEKPGSPHTGNIEYIVETPIYKKYFDRTKNVDSILKKVFVIYGEYGSGKTTFFEYLRNKVESLNQKIETICLPISTFSSSGTEIFEMVKYLLYII